MNNTLDTVIKKISDHTSSLLLLPVILTLFSSKALFIHGSLFSYYVYLISISFIIVIIGTCCLISNRRKDIEFPAPLILILLWGAYIVFNGLFINNNFGARHIYLIVTFFFILGLFLFNRIYSFNYEKLLWIICISSCLESLSCIFQYVGILSSNNPNFSITGTFVNPNVSAMLIALSFPPQIILFLKKKRRGILSLIIISSTLALLFLNCRTAVVGAITGSIIILYPYYGNLSLLRKRRSTITKYLLSVFCISICLIAAYNLYNWKKESADSRVNIWKRSLSVITENPVFGVGYGNFEVAFNLHQLRQIHKGESSYRNTGYVRMAYNEFIETSIEGGLIGSLLFGLLIISLLTPLKNILNYSDKTDKGEILICGLSGITIFVTMSMFNFTIQIAPLMLLFSLYVLMICANYSNKNSPFLSIPSPFRFYINNYAIVCIIVSSYLFMYSIQSCRDQIKNKVALNLINHHKYSIAYSKLKLLEPELGKTDGYWFNLGRTFIGMHQYSRAMESFEKALEFSSDPQLYMYKGICYQNLHKYIKAVENFQIVVNLQPDLIRPKVALLKAYSQLDNIPMVEKIANEILSQKSKKQTQESYRYKLLAKRVLEKIEASKGSLNTVGMWDNK